MRRGASSAVAVAFVLASAACGDGHVNYGATGLPAAALGACAESGVVEGPDAAVFISKPGAWIRVNTIDVANAPPNATADYAGSYTVVGGDETMTAPLGASPGALRIHASIAQGITKALTLGASVHVHTGVSDNPRHVAFALAIKDADFAFLGGCQYQLLTEPIAKQLGADATQTLSGLIGATSAELRRALVAVPPATTDEAVLNPEVTPADVLAKLEGGFFSLARVPDTWYGENTICTRIPAGWSDCIDLSSRETASIPVNYYFDPEQPAVEVWLLDGAATLASPIAKLAVVDLPALARRDRVNLEKPGVQISLTLASDPSLADVVANTSKASHAVDRVKLTQP